MDPQDWQSDSIAWVVFFIVTFPMFAVVKAILPWVHFLYVIAVATCLREVWRITKGEHH